ncbi:MAG: CbiX/SirB N-terminal domain-containing protein [Pseudomonadota bacterium]
MRGVIVFAHGSRDPLWRAPMDAVAARIAARAPGVVVRCAFLELTPPDLPGAAADMAAQGVTQAAILPMFLGVGRHAREDLPALVEALRTAHPQVAWRLLPAVGEDPRLLDLLADIGLGAIDS